MQTLTSDCRTVLEQFSETRAKFPDAVALRQGERQLRYDELDGQARQFAAYLAQLGVTNGSTVALCMERSFDWIVAALGILYAGAAYVPLDTAWPEARLRFALEDSGAAAVVACAPLLERLQSKARGIDLCRDSAAIASVSGFPLPYVSPDSLAYVIYTSGSTGVPKGVEITHANLAHLIRWHLEAFAVTPQDRASHLAGLGFDAAVWELWPYLAAGASVSLADDTVRSSPELIQAWMLREGVTIGFVPTVHAGPLLDMDWPADASLRFLLTGGDALQRGPSRALPFAVVNNYGPTEGTVVATSLVLTPGASGVPPIGRAITGASVYLLDENLEPVADGVPGEIYIGGAGIARGYRNLPKLTEKNFLADPFAGTPGARMYRTGDRAMRRADGEMEFRGRLDRQTKIRGQRVELDEIGSALMRHPSVEFATAVVSDAPGGEAQLAAYVLLKEDAAIPTARDLQNHLLRSLPDYMVPAVFARIEGLPISPNGKLDLKLLPPMAEAQLLAGRVEKASASPIEKKLLTMVRELLGNDAVGAEDSFFLAGGHSLLGMQLLILVRDAFGVDLTLRQLFEAPTVERLSVVIGRALDERRLTAIWSKVLQREEVGLDENFFEMGGDSALAATLLQRVSAEFGRRIALAELFEAPTIRQQAEMAQHSAREIPALPPGVLALQPHGTRNSIFWVHYLSVDLAKVIGDDQPFLYVAVTAEDFPALGESPSLKTIAACLLQKILTAQPAGPYTVGGFCLGGILAFEIAAQLRAAGHEVALLVLLDPPNPAYLESCDSLTSKLRYVRYAVSRGARLGLRVSLLYLREHLLKWFGRNLRIRTSRTEMSVAQEMIEAAALRHQPERYDGKVLLLLASERPPHVNFLPGWQAVVPHELYTQYLDGHHRDLLKGENLRHVAKAIVSHIPPTDDQPFPALAGATG